MQNIKISVIVPVYNAEKYLEECLDSVIGQNLHDIEIICVDDGSTDNSLLILKEYSKKDERIGVITQSNQGAGNARNAGMALAHGEYLAFMDADDLYYPEALKEAYVKAINTNADMVVFEAEYFDEHEKWNVLQLNKLLLADRWDYSARTESKYFFQIATCNPWCKLFRRGFVLENNLQYQEVKTANDLCFVCSAMAKAEKIAVLDKILVKHRVLHKSNLQSVKVKTPLDFWSALLMLRQNLQNFGLWDKLKRSYINCALAHCAYNWQTLDKPGRNQITAKSQEIAELLEFKKHSESYYYNRNDYDLMCMVAGIKGKGDVRFMGKLKEMLKHILPPPVKAFNREVAGIKQYMLELNARLEIQQKRQMEILQEQQQRQLDLLSKQYAEQVIAVESKNRAQLDLLKQQQMKIADIENRQQSIQEQLLKLDKLAQIRIDIESAKTNIIDKQKEKLTSFYGELSKESENNKVLIDDVSKKLQEISIENRQAFSGLKRDVKYVEQIIPNKPIYWDNGFERRMVAANWGDVTSQPDFADKFLRLTSGMDENSVEIIVRILLRLSSYLNSDEEKMDLFTRAEQEELRLLKENFDSEILKLSDNLYAYKKYLLPVNHFESSVFYFKHGLNELETLNTIGGKAVVDVGGFIGDSVLIFSELNPTKIYTFEAVPENFELLKKTVELNNIPNVVAENIALGAENGSIKMNVFGSMSTSIERKGVVYKDEIEVPVVTLDEYVEMHKLDVGLIKVDIEGGEPAFLSGAKKTICEQKPILLLSIYHNAHDFFELKPLIESWNLGYKFRIHKPTYGNTTSETLLLAEIR